MSDSSFKVCIWHTTKPERRGKTYIPQVFQTIFTEVTLETRYNIILELYWFKFVFDIYTNWKKKHLHDWIHPRTPSMSSFSSSNILIENNWYINDCQHNMKQMFPVSMCWHFDVFILRESCHLTIPCRGMHIIRYHSSFKEEYK